MDPADLRVAHLRAKITANESHLQSLRTQLREAEHAAESARQLNGAYQGGFPAEWIDEISSVLGPPPYGTPGDIAVKLRQDGRYEGAPTAATPQSMADETAGGSGEGRWPLLAEEYKRYGRQMILPEIGLHGQLRLKNAKVLIVGVGGLGCPVAAYLAGAGVGTLGLMDGDTVEVSNLHRQIAHGTSRVGMAKVDSAAEYLRSYVDLIPSIPDQST